jgi:MYXO-CTERM domain-containing protein
MSFLLRSLAAAVLSLCLVAGSARASQVVFGNLGSDGSEALAAGGFTTSASRWYAHRFTVGSDATFTNLNTATLGLSANSVASVANVSVSIYSNSATNSPSSLLFTSSALTVSSQDKYAFAFSDASLSNNATYWLVLSTPNLLWQTADSGDPPSDQNGSGYTYAGTWRTTNSGGLWSTSSSGESFSLSLVASQSGPEPIPEPGTWAAAALLIGAAAYVRWRRRPQAA